MPATTYNITGTVSYDYAPFGFSSPYDETSPEETFEFTVEAEDNAHAVELANIQFDKEYPKTVQKGAKFWYRDLSFDVALAG